ncbi:MAG: PGPGW domain-containing protein [Nitrospirae bacterium]|nr:PGPGW domain-containing protein [Nitrospirota bacterium]
MSTNQEKEAPKGKRDPIITTFQQAKRLVKIVVGFTVLLLGIAMLILPGPGWLAIFFALAILGTEFVWARRLYKRFKDGANSVKNSIFNNTKKP